MNYLKYLLLLTVIFTISGTSIGQIKWLALHTDNTLDDFIKKNGTADFSLNNGIITGVSKMNTSNTFLTTKRYYEDFVLEFDVWIEDGLNSGVQFRSNTDSAYYNGAVFGYQAEIETSNRKWAGGIYDESRRGWLYPLSINKTCAESFKKEEWNQYRVAALGNHIMTWVNDIPCANIYDDMTQSGFIGLQVHSISDSSQLGKEVKWKNLRICTSDIEEAISTFSPTAPSISYLDNVLSKDELNDGWELVPLAPCNTKRWNFPLEYSAFELEFDFKVYNGQLGEVLYHKHLEDSLIYVISSDHQSGNNQGKVGSLQSRTLSQNLSESDNNSIRYKGGGRWNKAKIVKTPSFVQHWLNNILLVEYPIPMLKNDNNDRGKQAIQFSFDHMPSIRSIKIRNLKL